MNIINCTPHTVTVDGTWHRSLYHADGEDWADTTVDYEPSGEVARVTSTHKLAYQHKTNVDDYNRIFIDIYDIKYGEVEGLPTPKPDTLYIVSSIVLERAKAAGRTDCIAPRTSDAHRDTDNRIIGVKGFIQ